MLQRYFHFSEYQTSLCVENNSSVFENLFYTIRKALFRLRTMANTQVNNFGERILQKPAEKAEKVTVSCRKPRKLIETWKQYSDRKFSGFFSHHFRPVLTGKHRKMAGIHRKKSENFWPEY
jgi:hypothetical protein